jgi:TRAP-type C4-dicarboxylate transport system permease small subunit
MAQTSSSRSRTRKNNNRFALDKPTRGRSGRAFLNGSRGGTIMKTLKSVSEGLVTLTHNIAAILLATATALIFWQVVTRFILGDAAAWSEVLARGVVIWMVFLVAGAAFRLGAMIPLEFLRSVLPPNARRLVMIAVTGLTLLALAVLVWYGIQMTIRVRTQQIAMLNLPMSWFYSAIPIGALLAIPGVLLAHFAPVDLPKELVE